LTNLCDTSILAVPHRALNGSHIPATFDFEHTNASARFGTNIGDSRTREELNAVGFPAKHLDDGLAVQPMYYYMGHISRYVRPGSRAVNGIVNSAKSGLRTFRSPGQVVAGGGMNDLARVGIEVTGWPCEGSPRQQFVWNKKKQLSVSGHDWLGTPTLSCIAISPDTSFLGLTLAECDDRAASFELIPADEGGKILFRQINTAAARTDVCLVLKPLQNQGGAYGPMGGAQVSFGSCNSTAAEWSYSMESGEISSDYLDEGEVCMTTGWPFLQMGAFSTPKGESDKTVVLLNEARDAANYVLYNGGDAILSGSIPPRSIQTILIDLTLS
jgi:glucosylceramidase